MPFFSVVIPAYNRPMDLHRALLSCINQTYTDFEVIVVDDGSAEDIKAVVEQFADPRFRYWRQENGGAPSARNTGVKLAAAPWVAYLDSDDYWLPAKLEIFAKYLAGIQGNRDKTVLFSQFYLYRGHRTTEIVPARAPLPAERVDEYSICERQFIQPSSLVVAAALARRVPWVERVRADDLLYVICLASEGGDFCFLPRPLTVFRDVIEGKRMSSKEEYMGPLVWMEQNRSRISEAAYWTFRGAATARIAAKTSLLLGLRYYFATLLRGKFKPKIALIALLQIILPRRIYRGMRTTKGRTSGEQIPPSVFSEIT